MANREIHIQRESTIPQDFFPQWFSSVLCKEWGLIGFTVTLEFVEEAGDILDEVVYWETPGSAISIAMRAGSQVLVCEPMIHIDEAVTIRHLRVQNGVVAGHIMDHSVQEPHVTFRLGSFDYISAEQHHSGEKCIVVRSSYHDTMIWFSQAVCECTDTNI